MKKLKILFVLLVLGSLLFSCKKTEETEQTQDTTNTQQQNVIDRNDTASEDDSIVSDNHDNISDENDIESEDSTDNEEKNDDEEDSTSDESAPMENAATVKIDRFNWGIEGGVLKFTLEATRLDEGNIDITDKKEGDNLIVTIKKVTRDSFTKWVKSENPDSKCEYSLSEGWAEKVECSWEENTQVSEYTFYLAEGKSYSVNIETSESDTNQVTITIEIK